MVRSSLSRLKSFTAATGLAVCALPASALKIELLNSNSLTPGSEAYSGFAQAAHFWELAITNSATVTINVGFSALGGGVQASTTSSTNVAYVGTVLPALAASGDSALDTIVASHLPTTRTSNLVGGKAIDAMISAPKTNGNGVALPLSRVLDVDAGTNNATLSANTSLLKALGMMPTYTPANAAKADGTIQFSSLTAFDFDPTNGIDANKIDFVGVAIREIGYVLGFRSGVDFYDSNANLAAKLGGYTSMTVWDFFRYSGKSAALGVNDWAIGGSAATGDAPYFSIDGGRTVYDGDAYFSTGATRGDGRKASYWKDNVTGQEALGAMDPTADFGQQIVVHSLDLAAMDAMGWNIAYDVMAFDDYEFSTRIIPSLTSLPEPGSLALVALAVGAGVISRRRKTQHTA